MTYDFKDMAIRNMVGQEHQPTELGVFMPGGYLFGSGPLCKACTDPWPCDPITALREYDAEQVKAHHARMAEGGYQMDMGPW